jgi:hypothetical protein
MAAGEEDSEEVWQTVLETAVIAALELSRQYEHGSRWAHINSTATGSGSVDLDEALRYYQLVITAVEYAEAADCSSCDVPAFAKGDVVEADFEAGGAWYPAIIEAVVHTQQVRWLAATGCI